MKKVLFILLFCATIAQISNAQAKYDTVRCEARNITNFVEKSTKSGNSRIYAVYRDEKNNILDFIPVSLQVYEYIQLCKKYGLEPELGIKLRNKKIYSIVRIRREYDEE